MDEQVKKYNKLINQLLETISLEFNNNPMIDTIRRRFRVALSIDRTYIIEETSPELLEYRDIIHEGRWSDLIYKDWESQIDNKKGALMYEVDNRSLRDMIGLLRQIWERYDTEQKLYVEKSMKKLLSYCVKYHTAKREGRA